MSDDEWAARDALWQMTNAYQASQAIHVAATLGIADMLSDGPGARTSWPRLRGRMRAYPLPALPRAGQRVLAESDEHDSRFGLTPLAEWLRSDAPGSVQAWAVHIGQPYYWTSWAHLLDSVRTGAPAFPSYRDQVWNYRRCARKTRSSTPP